MPCSTAAALSAWLRFWFHIAGELRFLILLLVVDLLLAVANRAQVQVVVDETKPTHLLGLVLLALLPRRLLVVC
jgi:hypothetical protein|tara:strand:+ start:186 stop:407 length:222 start_codon:yes stop_codon:yes gene_type:complete